MMKKALLPHHTELNYNDFVKALQKLLILPLRDGSKKTLNEGEPRLWYEIFAHYPIMRLQEAVKYWLEKHERFPVPIELLKVVDTLIMESAKKPHPSPKALLTEGETVVTKECPGCYGSGLVQRKEIKMGIPYQISYACSCPEGLKWQKTNFWATLKKYSRGDLKYSNNPFELLKNAEQIIGKKRFYCARALTDEGKQDYICQNTCAESRLAWCYGNIAGIKEQLNPA